MRSVLRLALAALVLLLFCALPFLELYAANVERIASPRRLIELAFWTAVGAAAVAAVLKLLRPRTPLWAVMTAAGFGTFALFAYGRVRAALPINEDIPLALGALILAWLLLIVAVLVLASRPRAGERELWFALALATVFAGPPALVAGQNLEWPQKVAAAPQSPAQHGTAKNPANIYFVVLDAYPRDDVLRDQFAYDNSQFIADLESRGFKVARESTSAFPVTEYSVATTFSMDYRIVDGPVLPDLGAMYPILTGDNAVVHRLERDGYQYVHFENGHSYAHMCAPGQAHCIRGNRGLDELQVKVLERTPVLDAVGVWSASGSEQPAADGGPDRRHPFGWGGVDDLIARLPAVWETPRPFILYAHTIMPHPPIRFDAECRHLSARPDLESWSADARPAFVAQLICTNRQSVALVDTILARDPGAIVILQSDHGTAFRGQFTRPIAQWDDEDKRERLSVLNAIRLPSSCTPPSDRLDLIDTFPTVLGCVTGQKVPGVPSRHFVTPYNDAPEYRSYIEISREALARRN